MRKGKRRIRRKGYIVRVINSDDKREAVQYIAILSSSLYA
jgi:hypothetical protein